MERDRFARKVGRFVNEQILDKDIIDTLWVATALGVYYTFKGYVDSKKVRMRNNVHRVIENKNVAPVNSNIVKEVGHIVEASF